MPAASREAEEKSEPVYAPTEADGKVKAVEEWNEAEVWGFISSLPYAHKLNKSIFEFTNGELLSEMNVEQLVILGVAGVLCPRLEDDINTKVIEIERIRIEIEKKEAEEEETERKRKVQESLANKKQPDVEIVCGCIPKIKVEQAEKRVYEGSEEGRQEVKVQLFLNSIGKIDSSTETWECDFWLRAIWTDEHLFEVRGSDDDFRADWDDPKWFQPKLEIVNSRELDIILEQKFVDGDEIFLEQRWRGTLHSDMDLHVFPYDHQELRIDVESSFHAAGLIKLVTASEDAALYSNKCVDHSEFKIVRATLESELNGLEFVTENDADFQRYSLVLQVARRSGFYVLKVGLVNVICVVIGCSINFISPDEPGDKLGLTTTMFLTLVAFQFVVADQLPKISYFTLLDYLVLICYVIMIANVTQTIIQYNRSYAGVDHAQLFIDDYHGFIALMSILFGAAFILSYYGVKSFVLSLFAVRETHAIAHGR